MTDRHRPTVHARPKTGWVNDPNGIGVWEGRWHVMCQHNPNAAYWGDISWAHLSSADLLHWREEPVALHQRADRIDAMGAWSGVALVADADRPPLLVYTAVPETGTGSGRVAIAEPVPGEPGVWRQPDSGVTPAAPEGVRDIRDPYLFEWEGRRLAIQGAGTEDGTPLVLLYDASDLHDWRYLGRLLTGDEPVAAEYAPGLLWECPQIARVGDDWLLLLSLWDDRPHGSEHFGPQRVAWLAGSLTTEGADSPDGLRFVPSSGGPFDAGTCAYAPQVVTDPATGNHLAWAWAWEGVLSDSVPAERDWAGLLTFPRVLELGPDGLTSRIHPAVLAAFDAPAGVAAAREADESGTWTAPAEGAWLVSTRAEQATADGADAPEVHVVVDVVTDDGEPVVPALTPLESLNPPGSGPFFDPDRPLVAVTGTSVLVTGDASILEIFADGLAHTVRVYPRPGERIRVRASHAANDGPAPLTIALASTTGYEADLPA